VRVVEPLGPNVLVTCDVGGNMLRAVLESDLTKPEYKGQVQMANPNSSGTAHMTLATMVQLFGEDDGFRFMRDLHKNINQYTKSGSAPIKAAGLGENMIGIVFMHDAVAHTAGGFPIVTVAPCEVTGCEIGSMSIIAALHKILLHPNHLHCRGTVIKLVARPHSCGCTGRKL
jgi:hypothetical protein